MLVITSYKVKNSSSEQHNGIIEAHRTIWTRIDFVISTNTEIQGK
jgi:hypothetical protein